MQQNTYIFCITISCHLFILCGSHALIGQDVRKAIRNKFNFVASLSYEDCNSTDEKNHFCGGVLISQKHILTSAHCKRNINDFKHDVVVKIGSRDLRSGQKYKIENWITFGEWKNNHNCSKTSLDEDISVIELSKPVDLRIKPAVVVKFDADNNFVGKTVVTAGWGTTDHGIYPRYMLIGYLKVIREEECIGNIDKADSNNTIQRLLTGQICTNAEPHVTLGCGDSGSPLLINGNNVIGINRASCPVQGEQYVPLEQNVHLRVDYYECFIDDVLSKENSNCLCWSQLGD